MHNVITMSKAEKKKLERCPRCKKNFGMLSIIPINDESISGFHFIHLFCATILELDSFYVNEKKENLLV